MEELLIPSTGYYIFYRNISLTGAEQLSPSQRNSPHSDSSKRAVTTAPAEHTHPRTTSATSSGCKRQLPHPLSIPSVALCKETAIKLAGKGVTRTRLAAGKGLRPTTSSLGERERCKWDVWNYEASKALFSKLFRSQAAKRPQTASRQCDTTHGQVPLDPAGSSLEPGAGARPGGEPGAGGHTAPGAGAAGPFPRLLSARPRHSPAPAPPAPPARTPTQPARCGRGTDPLWGGHRPSGPSAAAPPALGPCPAPSAADGTRRPPELTSGGRYGGLLAFPPRLRPFFFFVFEPPPPPGAGPPRPRSAAPDPPPAGRQQPPNSSDTRESMADTAAPPPRCSVRSAPRPAPPARLWPRRHRPPRGAPGKRVPPAYNAENAPRATRSKLHLPACPAVRFP